MFDKKITMYKSVVDTTEPIVVPLSTALKRIKDGNSEETVSQVRDGSKSRKKDLPIALFSGVFDGRKDQDLKTHSGLIVLDFDHINVSESKSLLGTDDYVLACWASPSGDGLKALINVSHPDKHRDHFRSLQSYFEKQYGLEVDPSGVNEARACYESYDPDLVINTTAQPFSMMLSEKALDQTAEIKTHRTYTDYGKLNIVCAMIRGSSDGEKHAVLCKAAMLAGGYIAAGRIEENESIRVIERELSFKEIDDLDHARRTLLDGIEQGKRQPIRETLQEEAAAIREMQINNGDMSFVASDVEDYNWIESYHRGDVEMGLTTGCVYLDKYFLFKKEFVVIVGHSNVGKTTMALNMLLASAIHHKWKWIVYSSENKTGAVKMRLMEFCLDKPIQFMSAEERSFAFDFVKNHFVLINNHETYGYTDMLVFAEKLIRQEEYQGLLIDPYNSLKLQMGQTGLNSHEYHYEAASELLTLSNKQNMAVWLNTHSITAAQRATGDDGLSVAPLGSEAESGSKFSNRSDSLLVWHRKVQAEDEDRRRITEFHVVKQRNKETGGEPTPRSHPVLFQINKNMTGFKTWVSGLKLFNPLSLDDRQKYLF
tara:strand:- start:3823 stop:5613 length:1791 start_codon:yes stop_codon:yes gene_type:complete